MPPISVAQQQKPRFANCNGGVITGCATYLVVMESKAQLTLVGPQVVAHEVRILQCNTSMCNM
jgi:hypothetical protein